jgi:hypothetical protein
MVVGDEVDEVDEGGPRMIVRMETSRLLIMMGPVKNFLLILKRSRILKMK